MAGESQVSVVDFPDIPDRSPPRKAPIRACFITPSLQMGGAERWILGLLQTLDRRCVIPAGVASLQDRSASHFWPIVEQCRSFVPVGFGIAAARAMVQSCDVAVAWGTETLGAVVGGYPGPVVFVSHGGGSGDALSWTQNVIRRSAAHITHCVGLSRTAAMAFGVDEEARTVAVIHNGADESRCTPLRTRCDVRREWGLRDGEIAVGYVGRYSPEKRPEAVAVAAAAAGEPYRAVMIGDGWRKDGTIALAKSICPNVIVVPAVEHVGNVLGALDCFMLASPAEGFSLALTEAWIAGVPSVATAVGAIPELERLHGPLTVRVAVNANGEELANAVRRAIAPANRAVVNQARSVSRKKFTVEAMGRRWTEYLIRVWAGLTQARKTPPKPPESPDSE